MSATILKSKLLLPPTFPHVPSSIYMNQSQSSFRRLPLLPRFTALDDCFLFKEQLKDTYN